MSKRTITDTIERPAAITFADGRVLDLSRPVVMGTLNVTPDSFSDGGQYTSRVFAVGRALEMEGHGAQIIDVGGESTRPGARPVSAEEEMRRVLPIVEGIRKASDIPISIDTYRAFTARAALAAGADIINDITGLRGDPDMAAVVAEARVPIVIMHMQGTPQDMQVEPHYDDCVKEVYEFFAERLNFCRERGIDAEQVILDPGIGFGKRLEDNLVLLASLRRFEGLGRPVMVGVSRKRFINAIHPSAKRPDQRLGGSLAAVLAAVVNGASIVRVHDVDQTVEAIKVLEAVRGAG